MPDHASRIFFERAIKNRHVNITMRILDIWCTPYNLKFKEILHLWKSTKILWSQMDKQCLLNTFSECFSPKFRSGTKFRSRKIPFEKKNTLGRNIRHCESIKLTLSFFFYYLAMFSDFVCISMPLILECIAQSKHPSQSEWHQIETFFDHWYSYAWVNRAHCCL